MSTTATHLSVERADDRSERNGRDADNGAAARQRGLRRFAGALVLAALILLGAAALRLAHVPEPRLLGFLAYRSGAITSFRRAEWPGRAAGLTVRDVVVALDDRPIADGPALQRELAAHRPGDRVELTVRKPDGALHQAFVTVSRFSPLDLGFALWLPFSIGLLYLLLGAVLFFARASTEATVAALLCGVASAFYMTMFDAHTTYRLLPVWLCYPLLGPLSVHLFARFPDRARWLSAPALLLLYLVGFGLVALRIAFRSDAQIHDRLALGSALMLGAEFLLDLGLLGWAALRSPSANARNRSKSIFVGLALTCGAAVAWQFAARSGTTMTAEQAMIASALFPFLIAYAILRRNLFDFDAVLRLGVISAVASAGVLAIYFTLVAVGGQLLMRVVGHSQLAAVVATLGVAVIFDPLRRAAQRLVDRTLYGGDLGPAVAQLGRTLQSCTSVKEWAATCLDQVGQLARDEPLALFVVDGKELHAVGSRGPGPTVDNPLSLDGVVWPDPRTATELPPLLADRLGQRGLGWALPLERNGRLLGLLATAVTPRYAVRRLLGELRPPLTLALDSLILSRQRGAQERLALLGEMAALIVHEVKNPLGIMRVAAKTLERRLPPGDAPAIELCNCIKEEVDRVDVTVHRLLDLARPMDPATAPVDLTRLLEQTSERLRPELEASGVQLELSVEALPEVRGDAEALRRALLNLVHNARQAMPQGGAVRLVGTQKGAMVEVAVEDNGPGVALDLRPLLFRPFSSRRPGGTGLGLAIVKRTLEEHHGTVRFEEVPTGGARFVMSIPAAAGTITAIVTS